MGDVFRQKKTVNGKTINSTRWYGQFRDENGKPKRVPLATDKQVSRKMLSDHVVRVEKIKAGLIDEFADSRSKPIEELVKDYLATLAVKGRSKSHIRDTKRIIPLVCKACGFDTLAKLKPSPLDTYLANMVKANGEPTSARTRISHRQAMMGFANWCVKKGKMEWNPLSRSEKPEGDAKVKRRALTEDEIRRLLDATRTRPLLEKKMVRRGPNKGQYTTKVTPEVQAKMERLGRLRELLYKAAFYTGLRRGELRALKVCHLTLDGENPRVTLPGEFTKNGDDAVIPLRMGFASQLNSWIQDEGLAGPDLVFPIGNRIADVIAKDMKLAGIRQYDDRGRKFDFHALRSCTATYMNKGGVPITTAKQVMRHSTVELTAGVYDDDAQHDHRGAVDKLPEL